MIDYFELCVCPEPFNPWSEVLVAHLAEMGFESFVEEEPILKAYLPASLVSDVAWESVLNNLSERGVKLSYSTNSIEGQNWNRMWEEQFEPVDLGNLLIIAPFHDLDPQNKKVIRILPKMSFGTGHHQTTAMMCQGMEKWDFKGARVLDFGCGTGILAIYAEILGASEIHAIDIEPWSVENTMENMHENGCSKGKAVVGGIEQIEGVVFDRVLANINRNVLIPSFQHFNRLMVSGGRLLLSGFFTSDAADIQEVANLFHFNLIASYENSSWACLDFVKN